MAEKQALTALFEKYIRKLRITPAWDTHLEFVEDPAWPKTGDIKIDCADRKAIILLNIANPKQEENFEEIIVHELMHIKMYPLDQVTESLIVNCFEEGSAASNFAYEQFFTTLEQTVEELAKCFLLEFGENKELSYGRCRQEKSFNEMCIRDRRRTGSRPCADRQRDRQASARGYAPTGRASCCTCSGRPWTGHSLSLIHILSATEMVMAARVENL